MINYWHEILLQFPYGYQDFQDNQGTLSIYGFNIINN
jgi:hypothetical protein